MSVDAIRILLISVLCAFCIGAQATTIKVRYLNGIQNTEEDAQASVRKLRAAYTVLKTPQMPAINDWYHYYNDGGSLGDDVIETALQSSLEGYAADLGEAAVNLFVKKQRAAGKAVSDNTVATLKRIRTEYWKNQFVSIALFYAERETGIRIGSVISKTLARIKEDLRDGSVVVIVAHSQGNLFASELASSNLLSASERSRLRFVGVGVAAPTTPDNRYVTLSGDLVVNLLFGKILKKIAINGVSPLPSNVSGYYIGDNVDPNPWTLVDDIYCVSNAINCIEIAGHNLSNVYANPAVLRSSNSPALDSVPLQIVKLIGESVADLNGPQQWDAVADFSFSKNPSGPWEYRYDSPTQPARRMLATKTNCSDLHMDCWKVDANAIDLPFVAINNSGATISQRTIVVPTGMLVLHPGFTSPAGLDWRPIVSWTAPATGTYAIAGKFQIVDNQPTGVRVLLKQDATTLVDQNLYGFNSVLPFALTRTLNAGQVLSFTVDPLGSYGNDSTGLVITITRQAPLLNPANGHRYEVIDCGTWTQCRDASVAKGGKIVTVRSQAENDWLIANVLPLINSTRNVWIGLRRVAPGGAFAWESGEPFTYTRWLSGQPNNGSGIENCVNTIRDVTFGGYWADSFCDASPITQAIVEYTN